MIGKNRFYGRIANGQLFAVAILVNGKQIQVLNCIKSYNQEVSMDAHYERFEAKFMNYSRPRFKGRHKKAIVVSKLLHRSTKLIVIMVFFTELVMLSLRLDEKITFPQVGTSTYKLTTSEERDSLICMLKCIVHIEGYKFILLYKYAYRFAQVFWISDMTKIGLKSKIIQC